MKKNEHSTRSNSSSSSNNNKVYPRSQFRPSSKVTIIKNSLDSIKIEHEEEDDEETDGKINDAVQKEIQALRSQIAQKFLPKIDVSNLELHPYPHLRIANINNNNSRNNNNKIDLDLDLDDNTELPFVDDSEDEDYVPSSIPKNNNNNSLRPFHSKRDKKLETKFKLFNKYKKRKNNKGRKSSRPTNNNSAFLKSQGEIQVVNHNNETGMEIGEENDREGVKRKMELVPAVPVKRFAYNEWVFFQLSTGLFRCETCAEEKKSRERLIIHIRSFHCPDECTYRCIECRVGFESRQMQELHERQHNRIGIAPKPKEGHPNTFIYADEWEFVEIPSLSGDIDKLDFQCLECNIIRPSQLMICQHIKNSHQTVSSHKCLRCGRAFKFNSALRAHQSKKSCGSKRTLERAVDLGNGNFSYKDKYFFTQSKAGVFKCSGCGQERATRTKIIVHIRMKHLPDSMVKRFECTLCHRSFQFRSQLANHRNKNACASRNRKWVSVKNEHSGELEWFYEGKWPVEIISLTLEGVKGNDDDCRFKCLTCGHISKTRILMGVHCRKHGGEGASSNDNNSSSLSIRNSSMQVGDGQYLYKGLWGYSQTTSPRGDICFQCDTCRVEKPIRNRIIIHIKNVHCPEDCSYKCNECNIGFESQQTYEMHKKQHSRQQSLLVAKDGDPDTFVYGDSWPFIRLSEEEFQCLTCNFSSHNTFKMTQHIHNTHYAPRRSVHKCQVCKKQFKFKSVLLLHTNKKNCNPRRCFEKSIDLGNGTFTYKDKWLFTLTDPTDKDGEMRCGACGEKTKDRRSMMVHIKCSHCPEECSYKCIECNIGFPGRVNLANHRKHHHEQKLYEEKVDCPGTFVQSGCEFVQLAQNEYACSICHHTARNIYLISQHVQKTHVQQVSTKIDHKCPKCKKSFRFKSLLLLHTKKNSCEGRSRSYPTKSVDLGNGTYSYKDRWLFSFMDAKLNGGSAAFLCLECGEEKPDKTSIVSHIRCQHCSEECTFRCKQCNLGFEGKLLLEKHRRLFHGQKPYKPKDGYPNTFVCSDGHEFIKISASEFQCLSCNASFTNDIQVSQHIQRLHIDPTKLNCKVCGKRCKSFGGLALHQLTHNVYTCSHSECGKQFKRKSNLVNHEKTHALGYDEVDSTKEKQRKRKMMMILSKTNGKGDDGLDGLEFVSRSWSRSKLKKMAQEEEQEDEEETRDNFHVREPRQSRSCVVVKQLTQQLSLEEEEEKEEEEEGDDNNADFDDYDDEEEINAPEIVVKGETIFRIKEEIDIFNSGGERY